MTRTRAVLWDLDGTLIDSMPAHVVAWRTVLKDIGIELDDLYVRLHEGEKAEVTVGRLIAEHGMNMSAVDLAGLIEKKRAIYRTMSPKGLIPAARRLIVELNGRGVESSIVTGSIRANLNGVVSSEEQSLFKRIISADDYEHGKPAPDPYLLGIAQSGFTAEECLAFENAPLGIQSAKAAGLRTVAITTTLPESYLNGADFIITSYEEVKGLL